jgi:hypothetical protein
MDITYLDTSVLNVIQDVQHVQEVQLYVHLAIIPNIYFQVLALLLVPQETMFQAQEFVMLVIPHVQPVLGM